MQRERNEDRMRGFASSVLRITVIGIIIFTLDLIFWLVVGSSNIYHNLVLALFLEAGVLMLAGGSARVYRGFPRQGFRIEPSRSSKKEIASSLLGLGLFFLLIAALISIVMRV